MKDIQQENAEEEVRVNEEEQNRESIFRKRFSSKYAKIGLITFIVAACVILFYYSFFKSNTLFGFLKSILSNITPFITGAVLAYLLKPICNVFEKWTIKWFKKMKNEHKAKKFSGNLSILFTSILFLLVLYVLFAAIIPQVIDSAKVLIDTLPDAFGNATKWVSNLFKGNPDMQKTINDFANNTSQMFNDWVTKFISTDTSKFISGLSTGVKGVFNVLKNVLIGSISCVYILGQRKKLGEQGKMIIYSAFNEKWADKIMSELHYTDRMFGGFINGKIIDSIIIGIICFIVTSIFRIPYALLISVVVGVTNIIPFFGPYIGAIPSAFIILMVSPIKCLYFIIIILIIQQFDGNILGPKILGNTTGLSSFWVLFAIIFFGGMYGFIGMLIGVPLFAVIYDIVRQLVKYGLSKRHKTELMDTYEKEKDMEEQAKEEEKAEKAMRIKKFRVNRRKK